MKNPESRLPIGWWITWLVVLLLAAWIPWLHWRYGVAEIIERYRYPWGLLPAHWLIFRWSGEIATYVLGFVVMTGVWAYLQPARGRAAVVLAAVVALAAAVACAAITVRFTISFMPEEAERISGEGKESP